MSTELIRVDLRLVHSQIITRQLTQCQINEIVAISTALGRDASMQEVFKMTAPKGAKITVVNVEDAVKRQQEGTFDKSRVMVLLKGMAELNAAVWASLKPEKIQIDGFGGRPGHKAANNMITLDRADADTLLELKRIGIEIYFQTTPDYPSEALQKAVAKL